MIRKEKNTPPEESQNPAPDESSLGENDTPSTDVETESVDIETEVERLRSEAADWQDKYLRKLAEFDNYRKRTRQESEMLGQLIAESIVASLLPIMDDFDRVIAGIPDPDSPYRKGVEMIRDKLRAFFDARGVSKCECVGRPFDPEEHDALMTQPTPDFPPGTVLNVITPGYRMGERVIRHAQVVVSAEAEIESPKDDDSATE
ncbi:nucleotide exchange factor GrpE [bacterium]|nr:nucleotide exchange factor GrpE [bacterium]MBU1984164.1 nucleotide exchange factor GrpE [bacterium]